MTVLGIRTPTVLLRPKFSKHSIGGWTSCRCRDGQQGIFCNLLDLRRQFSITTRALHRTYASHYRGFRMSPIVRKSRQICFKNLGGRAMIGLPTLEPTSKTPNASSIATLLCILQQRPPPQGFSTLPIQDWVEAEVSYLESTR